MGVEIEESKLHADAYKLLPKAIEEIELLQNYGTGSHDAYIAALERTIKDLSKALEWYADQSNYGTSWRKVCEDGGARARIALGNVE